MFNARQDVDSIRTQFLELGHCVGATYEALVAKSRLPARLSTTSGRAAAIVAKVFPDGITFIRTEARAVWAEAGRRCRRIVELDLVDEMAAVIGPEYFDAMQRATAALGEVIGTGSTPRNLPSRTGLRRSDRIASLLSGAADLHASSRMLRP